MCVTTANSSYMPRNFSGMPGPNLASIESLSTSLDEAVEAEADAEAEAEAEAPPCVCMCVHACAVCVSMSWWLAWDQSQHTLYRSRSTSTTAGSATSTCHRQLQCCSQVLFVVVAASSHGNIFVGRSWR